MIRLALGLVCLLGVAWAHPTHVTIGEGHWRPAQQVIEISLRLPTHHLQSALGKPTVSTEMVEAFVRGGFKVDGKVIGWVGAEVKLNDTWAYFTVPAQAGETLTLRNTLFFDRSTRQMNTLNLTVGAKRLTLQWSAGEPVQRLTLP